MDELIFILISWDEQGVCGNQATLRDGPGERGRMPGEELALFFLHLGKVSACVSLGERPLGWAGSLS